MKVSFDFDHSLTNPKYQELAKKFIAVGAEVHITTSRKPNIVGEKHLYDNRQVFEIAQQVGIDAKNITFTFYEEKYKFLKDFDLHFDDDQEEIYMINEHPCKCIGILIQDDF
jgi:hypothetical protein